jgi:hypothetical protein
MKIRVFYKELKIVGKITGEREIVKTLMHIPLHPFSHFGEEVRE